MLGNLSVGESEIEEAKLSMLYKIVADSWEGWESIPVGWDGVGEIDNIGSVGFLLFCSLRHDVKEKNDALNHDGEIEKLVQ